MKTMKTDMTGAAVVMGVMDIVARLELAIDLYGICALTDNNIGSSSYRPGDVLKVRDKSKKIPIFQDSMRRIEGDNPMPWLSLDKAKLTGTFLEIPKREDITEPINEQLVVELYSK